jgi:transglutaminase-like putative cysteine protease
MIPCNGYPGEPGNIKDVTMRLRFRRPLAADRDFSGPNQKILSRGEDWVEILVSRETITRTKLSQEQQDVFLSPDRFIQSEHPSIQTVVDSIRKEVDATGWELARILAAWVNRHIKNKNLEKGFATALEVLDAKAGDCTEHAVLLTALLRSADIPARPAVGLAYANGSFVGHMWTEAYVDHWRSLDAIDLSNDPIRIRISTSEDGRAVNEKELVRAYDVVGGMRVEVTNYRANAAE